MARDDHPFDLCLIDRVERVAYRPTGARKSSVYARDAPILGGVMKMRLLRGHGKVPALFIVLSYALLSCLASAAPPSSVSGDVPLTVPKATCGPNDHPETDLQGEVSAAVRAAGFNGYNCNL